MVQSALLPPPPKCCLGEGTGSAIPTLLLSQKRVCAQEGSKTLKSGLVVSVGSPPQFLKAANSVSNSGSKTESTILKRGDLETWSPVKQQAFISELRLGHAFRILQNQIGQKYRICYFLKISLGDQRQIKELKLNASVKNFQSGKKVKDPEAP